MPEKTFTLSQKDGTFFRKGDSIGVRFERIFDHPVPAVWKAITDPGLMAKWLAPTTITADTISLQLTGGTMGGRIIRREENHLIEYEWHNGTVVRWELLAEGSDRCRLIFTHSGVIESQLLGAATGWHYHMDALELILHGQAPPADAPKQWESISRDAASRYKIALQHLDGRSTIAMPR